MKRILWLLIRLYPAWWRHRYGKELEALLEDSGSGSRDVWDLFRAAMEVQMKTWSFARIVTVCGIAGVLLAGLVPLSMRYGRYESTAVLKIPAGDRPIDIVNEAAQTALRSNSLLTIVNDQSLYPRQRQVMPLESGINNVMRPAIQISRAGPGLVAVRFHSVDPSVAQRVTQLLAAKFAGFQVLDPAGPVKNEFVRTRLYHGGLGLLAGILFGTVLTMIFRRRAPIR